ncbi:hypothetical protein KI387_015229 [Taxus chinensis]|uniref:Hexosyltransferase n=1 Tax=Taxus chinensis TaxID=29808 RepID=A0AA38GEU7_TAXCH|nr:hypothetical protein KI387_015229 [Taxus chinensis]
MAPTPIGAFEGAKMGGYSKRGYLTFLAGNGDYVKGVVGLAKGLRKARSAYPLVVAMLPDVPEEHRQLLTRQGCICREIEPIYPPQNQVQFAMPYYVINYSKLRIWEVLTHFTLHISFENILSWFHRVINERVISFRFWNIVAAQFEEYSKMVYLDADIQVFENIDNLFDMPDSYFYAVMDCFCEKTWSHTPQYEIGYCQQCPDRVPWPQSEQGDPPALYFNAGMFVFEPSKLTFDSLMNRLMLTPPTPFAEQDFLNMFFRKVYKPIPLAYNLVLAMLWRHPENVELDKVKVVHYCAAGSKPWRYTGKEANMQREDIKLLVQKWWDIYDDKSLDFNTDEEEEEEETIRWSSLMAAIPAKASLIPAPSAA